MITVWIDEITPCLKDSFNGEIVETEVIPFKRKSVLKKYNKKTGWYVNWSELADDNEIYALVIKGTFDVQGLVAVKASNDMCAEFVSWMVTAPQNNPLITKQKRYIGVGGHLFAIAVQKSIENGFDGYITGFAANKKLEQHYIKVFNAKHIGIIHEYQFAIEESDALKIKESYTYEYSDNEL